MPITTPAIYFRDTTSRKTTYATVDALNTAKPDQVVVFNDDSLMIESVTFVYTKNTTNDPQSNPDGNDEINKQANGLREHVLIISGHADTTQTTNMLKLFSFIQKLQTEQVYHKKGIMGFFYPDATFFNLDPTDTKAYTFDKFETGHSGLAKTIMPFTFTFSLGGKI